MLDGIPKMMLLRHMDGLKSKEEKMLEMEILMICLKNGKID